MPRRLAAFFMILASLMAVGQAPRAEAAVVLASSVADPAEWQATAPGQTQLSERAPTLRLEAADRAYSEPAEAPVVPIAATRLGIDRARE